MSFSFDLPGLLVAVVIILFGAWAWSAERRFHSYLKPVERMWTVTFGWIINLCLLFFCVAFTFKLYTTTDSFALVLAVFFVFLIVFAMYLYFRWKVSVELIGYDAKKSFEKLRHKIETIEALKKDNADSPSDGDVER